MHGHLYGIGVGPGDPELITLKAVNALSRVDHVFAAASRKNDYSLALEVVKEHLPADVPVSRVGFSMSYETSCRESAWAEVCEQMAKPLSRDKAVAFLTLGDPMTFSTYVYIMRRLQELLPQMKITTIPGISCFQAAAAATNHPLVVGDELFTVIPGNNGAKRMDDAMRASDNLVFMKFHKKFPQLLKKLEEHNLQNNCIFVSRCTMTGEIIESDFERIRNLNPEYLSLLIVKKGDNEE